MCHCPSSDERYGMAFCGFEKDRKTLKYKCPVAAYGMECRGFDQCSEGTKGKVVNSRIDLSFGFEHHFIRGKAKMTLRVGLALLVMLSMALARVKREQEKDMRSLIKRAA